MDTLKKLQVVSTKILRIESLKPDLADFHHIECSTDAVQSYFIASEWYDEMYRNDLTVLRKAKQILEDELIVQEALDLSVF